MNNFRNCIFGLSSIIFILSFLPFFNINTDDSYKGNPTLFIYGDMKDMTTKEDVRNVTVSYLSEDVSFIKKAEIKIQGSSTIYYDKKNYTIKLYDDSEGNEKFNVDLGWGEYSKYVIKANWSDKTHARNIVSARVASSVSKKYGLFESAPNNGNIDGFPVDVYINGEFWGLYTFNMPKSDWMLGLDEDNEDHLALFGEFNRDGCFFKSDPDYVMWEMEIGEPTEENLSKFKRLYNFINDSSDSEFRDEFDSYLNLDAMLNYYVLVESLMLEDNVGKNLAFITYDGNIWYPVLYDMDAAFGVNPSGKFIYDYKHASLDKNLLFLRFKEIFWNEICDRYNELRKDILTVKNLNNEIDDFVNSISKESLEKENNKWSNIPGFDSSQMKEFVENRFIYLDEYFLKK